MRALVAALLLAAPVWAQGTGPIAEEAVFREVALDRLWLAEGGQVEIFSDGTLRADWGGRILTATWDWDAARGMMCRAGDFDGAPRPRECQVISLTLEGMSITRFEGRGPTFFFVPG